MIFAFFFALSLSLSLSFSLSLSLFLSISLSLSLSFSFSFSFYFYFSFSFSLCLCLCLCFCLCLCLCMSLSLSLCFSICRINIALFNVVFCMHTSTYTIIGTATLQRADSIKTYRRMLLLKCFYQPKCCNICRQCRHSLVSEIRLYESISEQNRPRN